MLLPGAFQLLVRNLVNALEQFQRSVGISLLPSSELCSFTAGGRLQLSSSGVADLISGLCWAV